MLMSQRSWNINLDMTLEDCCWPLRIFAEVLVMDVLKSACWQNNRVCVVLGFAKGLSF